MRSFRSRGADERKAMFANMLNSRYNPMMRFAEKSKPVAELVKAASSPLEVSESPISSVSYKVDVVPHGEKLDIIDIQKPEGIKFDETFYGGKLEQVLIPPIKGEIPPIDIPPEVEHGSVEPEVFDGELNIGVPPRVNVHRINMPAIQFKDELSSGFRQGVVQGVADVGRKVGSGELEVDVLKKGYGAVKSIHLPGLGIGKLHIPERLEKYGREALAVAVPAAEAFGMAAGTGVTETLRAGRGLISDPKREFYIPPGFQRVWTGEGDNYKMLPISTPQMQPVSFNVGMGAAMPPGVSAEPADIAELTRGEKSTPLFRQIEDKGKSAEVRMGTMEAGKIMERDRVPREVMSPKERIAKMGIKEAAEAFMGGRSGRMQEGAKAPLTYNPKAKSDKQVRIEAIMDMPIMQASEAYEKHAKIEITRPAVPTYVQQRQVAPTMPVRVEIPLSSSSARRVMV